ncbi:hypothetical protein BBJ29_007952 [Phytophthora kernoviae]|uniref:Uncharacterized protein n=1 Tax=Phytophthora kernoviae TaxID=325452 RepID=A0A3F2RRY9_9STRA|nr:hypothetical protein BBJ29_007952 [Phytophthora kernoviae]RLN63041.1 hypothetical protein BBP00_00004357 [Phytophthora kernoviae]
MHRERYPQITLSDAERAKYDQSARIFLLETMAERTKFDPEKIDPKQWEYVRRRQEMSVYHSVHGTPDPNVLLMLGTGLINGSIEDVMNGLYCDTTEELCTAKMLLGYSLAGGAVMNASERRSTKDPYRFAGIKWFACRSVWGLLRDRDVLTYERMGLTVDADGEEWAYHTLQSIRRPELPMEATPGTQRQHTATCYLYRPRRDLNKTEIFLWGSIYKFGKYPDKVIYFANRVMSAPNNLSWVATLRVLGVISVCKDCSRQKDTFALDIKGKKPARRLFCILCIKSVIGSAHWSVDDHIETSTVESEPMTVSTCTESVGSIRSDSLLGERQFADPFRPRVTPSPTSNLPILGAQGPLDPNAQLVLDW